MYPRRGSGSWLPQNRRASKRWSGDQRTSACLLLAREQGPKETGRRGSADRAPKSRTTNGDARLGYARANYVSSFERL